uniref:Uncharacterized protein n=1 Tax=Physcomitrium patens TaxID=3218 RepID=A0A2K1ITR9_PHYPA|nr:hypothetical protein PHYPA_024622 [Physcomitrium patens]
MAVSKPFGRRFLGFAVPHWVSKVGPSTPRSPQQSTEGAPSSVNHHSRAANIVVIVFAVATFVTIMIFVLILRRNRLREQTSNAADSVVNQQKREGQEEESQSGERKWSADTVELVVMAGETQPTFLAHPRPAPSTNVI